VLKRLAVLGHPVGHSRSPAMHNAALAALGLDGSWAYEAIDVAPEQFAERVAAMPGEGFAGANVTVPHKLAALELAGEASEAARAIGAANTLTFADDGVRADNTDASGFLAAIGESPRGKRALVLGAGGSARAVVWALVTEGAEVSIWNRTHGKAQALARELGGSVGSPADFGLRATDYDLIVNCTTVGMAQASGEDGPSLKDLPIRADAVSATHVVVDLAYGSQDTDLVRTAKERGARTVDGLEVLVHQGAQAFRIWTGMEPSVEVMRRAARSFK
jgi:shikimate dehydrogenase